MRENESSCARKPCEDSATHTRLHEDGSEDLLCCNHFEDEVNAPIVAGIAAASVGL